MNTNISMVSQILHLKKVMKTIKRYSDIDHIWSLQICLQEIYRKLVDNGAVPTIKFSIAKLVQGNTFIYNCNLCLSDKAKEMIRNMIGNLDDVNMLNKTSEFSVNI